MKLSKSDWTRGALGEFDWWRPTTVPVAVVLLMVQSLAMPMAQAQSAADPYR